MRELAQQAVIIDQRKTVHVLIFVEQTILLQTMAGIQFNHMMWILNPFVRDLVIEGKCVAVCIDFPVGALQLLLEAV